MALLVGPREASSATAHVDETTSFELRVAVDPPAANTAKASWFPIAQAKGQGSSRQDHSRLRLPLERQVAGHWQGSLWDAPEHTLLADGSWHVLKCDVVPAPSSRGRRFWLRIVLDRTAAAAMRRITRKHPNKKLAIVAGGTIVAAPIIRSELGATVVIAGNFTRKEAEQLSRAIGGGRKD